jgi:ferredoxin
MPFVVTDACIQCKYTDCVSVCPMDCFVEGPNFLVIEPNGCIDCSMCVAECPVGAIYNATDLPAHLQHFEALNEKLSQHPGWKPITSAKAPLPDHAEWKDVTNKLDQLILPD